MKMNLKAKSLFRVISIVIIGLSGSASIAQTYDGRQSITIEELKNHMYFLASDFLGGRVSYEAGYNIAAEYCASQFKSVGLETIIRDKDGNPTYFQEVPLIKRKVAQDCNISLKSSREAVILKSGEDFKIPDRIMNIPDSEVELVFAGYGIEEPKYKWNDFAKLDVKGKAVVIMMGSPQKNGKGILPDSIDKKYKSIQGFQFKAMNLIEKRPSVVILIPDSDLLSMIPWTIFPHYGEGDRYSYANEEKNDDGFNIPVFYVLNPQSINKVFKNQSYSPEIIEKSGLKGYKTFQLNDLRVKPNFTISESDTIYTKNIVGVLKGTDENLSKQYVTVGAHLDHVPMQNGKVCNGADDNASGSIGVLELAESMVVQAPRRSVLFIIYAGEELGLIGSFHFVNTPPVPVQNMIININLDMIGRTDPENETTKAHYVMVHKEYLEEMTKLVSEVNKIGVGWPLIFEDCKKTPGDSDHSSFHNKGIPNLHFFSGMHKDLHTPKDDAENIEYEKMQKIIQLVFDLIYKVADMDQLPFVKK